MIFGIFLSVAAIRHSWSAKDAMAIIGTFTAIDTGFVGEIVTLSVQARNVRIMRDDRATGKNAPSHRMLVGRTVYAG